MSLLLGYSREELSGIVHATEWWPGLQSRTRCGQRVVGPLQDTRGNYYLQTDLNYILTWPKLLQAEAPATCIGCLASG